MSLACVEDILDGAFFGASENKEVASMKDLKLDGRTIWDDRK
jgi:hypothetical protein